MLLSTDFIKTGLVCTNISLPSQIFDSRVWSNGCKLESFKNYSRLFSVLIDTLITGALYVLKRGKHSQKGAIVTGQDMAKHAKMFKIYSLLYPVISLFVLLDKISPFLHGNMLITKYRKDLTS